MYKASNYVGGQNSRNSTIKQLQKLRLPKLHLPTDTDSGARSPSCTCFCFVFCFFFARRVGKGVLPVHVSNKIEKSCNNQKKPDQTRDAKCCQLHTARQRVAQLTSNWKRHRLRRARGARRPSLERRAPVVSRKGRARTFESEYVGVHLISE